MPVATAAAPNTAPAAMAAIVLAAIARTRPGWKPAASSDAPTLFLTSR